MAAVISWEDLPPLLLDLVLDRLPVPDYHRFAAVCPSWCDAQRDHLRRRRPHGSQMPWLITLPNHYRCPPHQPSFYSPSEKRNYNLPFLNKPFHGASHGWLLLTDDTPDALNSLFLVNPFAPTGTESEIEIPLPYTNCVTPTSAFLSSVPTDPDCVVLLWLWGDDYYFCRLNTATANSWMKVPEKEFPYIQEDHPLIYNGKFYAITFYDYTHGHQLFVAELFPVPVTRTLEMEIVGMSPPIPLLSHILDYYLVKSDGQIWLVWLFFKRDEESFNPLIPKEFHVFKADLSRKLWVRLESLGDRVIFLVISNDCDSRQPFTLSAAETGGPGNRIYCNDYNCSSLIEFNYESCQVMSSKLQAATYGDSPSWIAPNLW